MNTTIRYYSSRESVAVWGAIVACIGVVGVGSSFAQHSLMLTSEILLGTVAVWYLGYWTLSKSHYFISPTAVGFKDAFRTRDVQFEEIRSVARHTTGKSSKLIFVCNTRTVTMPVDLFDETWFLAVKDELDKRGIPFSSTAYGFPMKEE